MKIITIANGIRHSLRDSRFECLASLLCRLGEDFWADEIGLLERFEGEDRVRIKRRVKRSVDTSFDDRVLDPESSADIVQGADSALSLICTAAENPSKPFFRYFDNGETVESLGIRATRSWDWILVVSVWPSPHWLAHQQSRYWLYVWTPRRFLGPGIGDGKHLAEELLSLGSEWFGWKHNRLAFREQLLQNPSNAPQDVVNALERTIVRPVLPIHMSKVLRALIKASPKGMLGLIEVDKYRNNSEQVIRLAEPCANPKLLGGDAPPLGHACKGCETCPQKDYHDLIRIIAELVVWETGFWRATVSTGFRSDAYLLSTQNAVTALECAAFVLDSNTGDMRMRLDVDNVFLGSSHSRERVLLRFFVARAIRDAIIRFRVNWLPDVRRATVGELQYLAELAELAVLLLTDDDWTPDALRNVIRVIAGYGHLVLSVPSIIDLARHLRQTLRGESALYTLKQRYRDHFFHTIEVCLIGFAFLRSRPNGIGENTLAELLPQKCRSWLKANVSDAHKVNASHEDVQVDFVPTDGQAFLAQWWVASLIHDTAYGIDVLKSTMDLLDFFGNHDAIGDFHRSVAAQIEHLHEDLRSVAPELKDDPTIGKGDHGVIAASHLQQSLQRNDSKLAETYLAAIRAIAFHNTKYPLIDAARDPVAALLILCDTIQDWGRSQLGYDRSATVILSRLVSSAGTPTEEQFGPVKAFSFSMTPAAQVARAPRVIGNGMLPSTAGWEPAEHVWSQSNGEPQLMITLDYSQRACKGTSVFFNWADTTLNLRRVDVRPWGLDLRIRHRLPFTSNGGMPKMQELAQFVYREEIGFIEPWVRLACQQNETRAVCHTLIQQGDDVWETLTFNLLELSRTFADGDRLMLGTLGAFEDAISRMPNPLAPLDTQEPRQRSPVVLKPQNKQ